MKDETEKEDSNDSGIVDAKNFKIADRGEAQFELEKEEREALKKNAKAAPKGAYVAATNLLVDNRKFKRGDDYDGKLYADLIAAKAVMTKEEWTNRK